MRYLYIFLACLTISGSVMSADESFQALFEKGNRLFESGDIEAARDTFKSIVKQGCRNKAVFYNLANCHFQLGDIGRAVLNYRRAELLDPRDGDVQTNLGLARNLVEKPVKIHRGWFQNFTELVFYRWNPQLITVVFITLYLFLTFAVVASLLIFRRRLRKRIIRMIYILIVFTLVAGYSLFHQMRQFSSENMAIAVDKSVIARTGPGSNFKEVYRQYAGYEMTVKRTEAGWHEVELPNGYTGWVPSDSIQFVW